MNSESSNLPTIALSIRQPWAWLIVNGYKDIENRSRCIKNFLGPVLIHASQTFSQGDYDACLLFCASDERLRKAGIALLNENQLYRGGIVGVADITAHGDWPMKSPWWTGPYSYTIRDARPLPFKPCKGRLGFFPCDYTTL
jgi:hypothetical protein